MNLTIFLILGLLALLLIIYGHTYNHGEMTMVGFATFFILGLTITGAQGLYGGTGGISFKTGENASYTYPANVTAPDTVTTTYIYTEYNSVFFGSWIAIMAFFGFFGVLTGRRIFG